MSEVTKITEKLTLPITKISKESNSKLAYTTESITEETKPKTSAKILLVIRGLAGTGKTTIAEYFANKVKSSTIISSDNYWSDDNKFDREKVNEAFKWCYETLFKDAIKKEVELIILDNSNIKKTHYMKYVDYAINHNYLVIVGVLPFYHMSEREMIVNSNKVSKVSTIRKMKEEFEWDVFPFVNIKKSDREE